MNQDARLKQSYLSSLEMSERGSWPRNALNFTSMLLDSLKVVDSSPDGQMAQLFDSIHIFEEMATLYEKYKIPITFSKFTQVIETTLTSSVL